MTDRYQAHVQYQQDPVTIPVARVEYSTWEDFTFSQIQQQLVRNELASKTTQYLDPSLKLPGNFGFKAIPFNFNRGME